MFGSFIELLREELKGELPGIEAQQKFSSTRMPLAKIRDDHRKSAVMILLYPKDSEIYSTLIKRPVYKGVHSGQISLPGGKHDLKDPDLEYTALRELEEEVGVDRTKVQVIQRLTQVYIPPTNFVITPFIGYSENIPVFKADEREVDRIIHYPISQLVNPETVRFKEFELLEDMTKNLPYFDIDNEIVWGATALIINELKTLIKSTNFFSNYITC